MGARSKARKRALDVLFEADQRGVNVLEVLAARQADSGRETPLPAYSSEIVTGVAQHWLAINALISELSTEWTITRMPAVDRAVLRIGAWEILYNPEVSASVAIDEAVTLASDLSTDDSATFVNGVLGAMARHTSAVTASDES